MRHLAHDDTLTGLPNRLLLADPCQAILDAQRNDGKLEVIYFDFDRFKPVNDNFGHDVGDCLLQQLAMRLRGALRASDTSARLGGGEFVILLPRCAGKAEIAKIAAKILKLLDRESVVADVSLGISGSLGLAIFPDDARDEDGLLRSADQAMYRAKAGGRSGSARMGRSRRFPRAPRFRLVAAFTIVDALPARGRPGYL